MHYRDTLIVSPDASFKSILVWLRFATILSQVWKFGCTRLVGRPLCESHGEVCCLEPKLSELRSFQSSANGANSQSEAVDTPNIERVSLNIFGDVAFATN